MKQMNKKKKIIFVIGPTGSGKTEVGLRLARLLPCAFISADSMQVYKGMDIVTDKLDPAARKKYPHHLIDIIAPSREYSVAAFCRKAERSVRSIIREGKLPIVIGGTGLYIHALVYGIFKGARTSRKLRHELEKEAQGEGLSFLYGRLKREDPAAAARINANDKKRIIRALEVFESTRKPISEWQRQRRGLGATYDVYLFGIRRERPDLYRRIDQRVDFMVHAGLLDEVRALLKNKLSRTATYCIGIREIEGYLEGRHTFEEAIRLIKRNSRRFAKRQLTWFQKMKEIEWVGVAPQEDAASVANRIAASVKLRR